MSEAVLQRMPWARRRRSRATQAVGFALILLVACSGCVHRTMTIRTNPPGAFVFIDDTPIGVTPCTTPFTYYGTRKIRIVKDGFETLTTYQKIATPWYEWPGVDFVTENFWPGDIRDDRTLQFQLEPQQIVPPMAVIARGDNMRQATRGELLGPPPGVMVGPNGEPLLDPACAPGLESNPPCLNDGEPPRMVPFSGE